MDDFKKQVWVRIKLLGRISGGQLNRRANVFENARGAEPVSIEKPLSPLNQPAKTCFSLLEHLLGSTGSQQLEHAGEQFVGLDRFGQNHVGAFSEKDAVVT